MCECVRESGFLCLSASVLHCYLGQFTPKTLRKMERFEHALWSWVLLTELLGPNACDFMHL